MAETTTVSTRTFELEVISPERLLLRARVRSAQVPASDGLLGILAGHAPLVAAIVPGVLKLVGEDGRELRLAVGEGFVEVLANHVRVLVDSAEKAEEIDVERALQAKLRAEGRISSHGHEIDIVRAQAALARAVARLKATRTL